MRSAAGAAAVLRGRAGTGGSIETLGYMWAFGKTPVISEMKGLRQQVDSAVFDGCRASALLFFSAEGR